LDGVSTLGLAAIERSNLDRTPPGRSPDGGRPDQLTRVGATPSPKQGRAPCR